MHLWLAMHLLQVNPSEINRLKRNGSLSSISAIIDKLPKAHVRARSDKKTDVAKSTLMIESLIRSSSAISSNSE